MLNVYELIRSSLHFNKFEVGELVFVEYTCPLEEDSLGIWTQCDYMLYVLSGKKNWRTTNGAWCAEPGQTFYVKKGAYIIDQFFEEEFCMLLFYITDDFIRQAVREISDRPLQILESEQKQESVLAVKNDVTMIAYFQSMLTYFTKREQPSDTLLELKLKELLINILQSPSNPELSTYFHTLTSYKNPSLMEVMEANFCYNLSLENFAKMCHLSLSSFKRDFKKCYQIPPGKWLIQKRLAHAKKLLANGEQNMSQICLDCGFKNVSHFSRIFKEEFNLTPTDYRKQLIAP